MQKILYRDNPYIILWYNVNLQAFRTDAWKGYTRMPAADGAPFWNYMRTTYIDLRPVETGAEKSGGTSARVWAVAVAIVLATVVVLVRRRPRAFEDA